MRKQILWAVAVVLSLAVSAWADEPQYDPAAVVTFTGEVVETGGGGIPGMLGWSYDQQIIVRNDRETLPVLLGPKTYIDTQNYKPEKGQRVTITGSRILVNDKPTIIAREVWRGNDVLRLRASDGTPLWKKTELTPDK